MTAAEGYALLGIALFVLGLYRLAISDESLRRLLALNVMGVGVFMFLVANSAGQSPDSVPHAMVLTGIVVAVSATAFALALIVALENR